MYYVYVLQSEVSNRYYISQCKDLELRVCQHNNSSRKGNYTKSDRPWKLVYSEEYDTRAESVRREKYLKNLKSRKAIEEIIMGP